MTAAGDILRIEDLGIGFALHAWDFDAVKGASFRVLPGKVTALVGESGSGKSVISQAIMGILPRPGRSRTAEILFADRERRTSRSTSRQLPPTATRSARIRGGRIVDDLPGADDVAVAAAHDRRPDRRGAVASITDVRQGERRERTEEMLRLVGFPDPQRALSTCIRSSCRAACASAR